MLNSLRHPRKRGVSIGPQSEADAREFIAYREKRRRDSRSSQDGNIATSPHPTLGKASTSGYFAPPTPTEDGEDPFASPAQRVGGQVEKVAQGGDGAMLRPGNVPRQPLTPPASDSGNISDAGGGRDTEEDENEQEKKQDHEMFLALEIPRVRYDVEVITKLVVYAGKSRCFVEGRRWQHREY